MRLLLLLLCATMVRADDLSLLSDEFDSNQTLPNWRRIYQAEGWGNNALETLDINSGRMIMMPHTSSWYEEYRGELTYKEVTGDFVITTDVEPTNRTGAGAPRTQYSLAGIMVRTPRTMTTPAQWTPLGQNYVFLSLGAADTPGQFQFEVKTTLNSASTLFITPGASRATIQVARIGRHLIMLRRAAGGAWQVHRRYNRPDMPATLQAGLTVYTDWPTCSAVGFQNQNTRVLTNGAALSGGGVVTGANPDLIANFDYVRYQRPNVPANLNGANLSEPASVSDAQLLAFLGDNANTPGGSREPAQFTLTQLGQQQFHAQAALQTNRTYRIQTTTALGSSWTDITNIVSTNTVFDLQTTPNSSERYFRIVSP